MSGQQIIDRWEQEESDESDESDQSEVKPRTMTFQLHIAWPSGETQFVAQSPEFAESRASVPAFNQWLREEKYKRILPPKAKGWLVVRSDSPQFVQQAELLAG